MGDSQNWSSFDDEPVAPARRARAKANAQSVGQTPPPEQPQAKGAFDKLQGLDLRNFRNRLMFGGLVGFCTGATFGASTYLMHALCINGSCCRIHHTRAVCMRMQLIP
jgi:hypothetical protein